MNNCCGGNGCGTVYTNEVYDMLLSLDLIKEANLLTSKELDALFRAVISYDETAYEESVVK